MTCYQGGRRAFAFAKAWVVVAFALLSFVGGLSTPFPVHAGVGLGDFIVVPHIPGMDPPESSPAQVAAPPQRDSVSDNVGATVAQMRVDESGAATYSVPIQVTAGTAGMTPKLALAYTSRGPNGVMGPGWGIQGTSQITRCRQARENGDFMNGTTPIDGNPAPINFTSSDRYCLDGVRLLVTSGSYGANNSVYSPENDPTTQVTAAVTTPAAGPDSFTVKRMGGTTSTYGKTATSSNARIVATLPATGATVAVSWALARVQDTAGNYLDYVYNIAPGNGTYPFPAVEYTLSQVNYTGHATTPVSAPYASVSFSYTTLTTPKVRLGYQAGIAFLQSQQLSSVTVTDNSVAVRYYKLSYQASGSGSALSTLSSIQECRDSTQAVCFRPTTFGWSAATYAFNDSASQSGPSFANLVGYKVADVDGDGRQDVVYAVNGDSHCTGGVSAVYVGYADQTASHAMTLTTAGQVPACATIDLAAKDRAWNLIDYNGDGKADLLIGGGAGSAWKIFAGGNRPASGGRAFGTTDLLAGLADPILVPGIGSWTSAAGVVADLNGDGLPDFIYGSNMSGMPGPTLGIRLLRRQAGALVFSSAYYLNLNFSDTHCTAAGIQYCAINFFSKNASNVIDIDGDGRADLSLTVVQVATGSKLAKANPDVEGIVFDESIGSPSPSGLVSLDGVSIDVTTYPTYLYQFVAGAVQPSCGGVFTVTCIDFNQYWSGITGTSAGNLPTDNTKVWVVDLNGDGLTDLLYQDPVTSTTYWAMVNRGNGYQAAVSVSGINSSGAVPPIQLADINGDGKVDLVYFPTSSSASYVDLVPTTSASGTWTFSTASPVLGGGVKAASGQVSLLNDFDGDGAADFLAITPSGGSNNVYASRSAGAPSSTCKAATNASACSRYHARDVVVDFTNGHGAKSSVVYQPLTNGGVYQQTVAGTRAVTNDVYGYGSPVFDLLAPLYVVSEAHSSAPTQGSPTATSDVFYRYEGALMQSGGRGFLGFWSVWTFDGNDSANEGNKYIVSLVGYGQEYPFIGLPQTTFKLAFSGALSRGSATLDTCALNGPESTSGCFKAARWPDLLATGVMVGFSGTQPACLGAGCQALDNPQLAQCSNAATSFDVDSSGDPSISGLFTPPAAPSPIFVYAYQSSDTQYELTSPAGIANAWMTTVTQTTSCYDSTTRASYSNLLNNRIVTRDSNGIVAQKLTKNTYVDSTSNWWIGRLSQSQITFKRPNQSDVVRKSNFTYDPTTGILNSERVQSGGAADQDLRTIYTLDPWGNRTGAYQCSADLSDSTCTSTSFAQQQAYGTSVHRYAKTTWDSIGRYTTGSRLPFYTAGGTTHLTEQTAVSVTSRDEFGNPTTQPSINGLTQTALFGALGRPYFTGDNTGKASTTTYRICGAGTNQVGCSSDAMLKFRAQTVSAGQPTTWTYYDVLGRPVLAITQSFDGNDAGKLFTAMCSYRDAHDRPKYQSEPFFLNVAAGTDGSPTLPTSAASPCASAGYATTTNYDVLGRVVSVTNPDGGEVKRQYTGLDTDTENPRHYVWSERKNGLGEVVRTQDPVVSGDASVGLFVDTTYDAAGNVLSVSRDAQHNGMVSSTTKIVTSFTYDALGRKKTQTDPDSGTTTFNYNATGDLIRQVDAKGQALQQSFDALGRRWQRIANGADGNVLTDTWTYDTSANGYGQLAKETRSATTGTPFTRTFGYDTYGRSSGRTTSIDATAYSETTAYDSVSRLKSQQDASGYNLTTSYTAHGYVSQLTDSRAGTVYVVDKRTARGQIEQDRRAGKAVLQSALTYDAATGRISSVCSGVQTGTGRCNLQDLAYSFDNAGNLLSRSRATLSAPTTETFTHDALDRLTLAKLTKINGVTQSPAVPTNTLSYDLLGNVCNKNTVAYTYPGPSGCAGSGTSGSPHAVSKVTLGAASTTYLYDGNGNQSSRSGSPARVLGYNALNQPSSATLGSGVTTVFEYAPSGDRFRHADVAPIQWPAGCRSATDRIFCNGFEGGQTGGTQTTLYVGNVEIVVAGGSTTYRRYLGGVAIDTVRAGTGYIAYVYTDHLGSLDVLANSTGGLIAQMSFDVHGNRRDPIAWQGAGSAPGTTPRGFTGHEHLDTFGLVHMNGRLYDPVLGRMVQVDPLTGPGAQGLNGYSYVVNNPLALTDPTGYSWWGDVLKIAAVVVIDYLTAGWANMYFAEAEYFTGMAIVAGGGALSGYVLTGTGNGALAGAFSAVLFAEIGQYFDGATWAHEGGSIGATNLNQIGYSMKILSHGVAGGVMTSLQGGKFGNGFLSAGFSEALAPKIDKLDPQNPVGKTVSAARIVASGIVGGTASVLGGGKFANGAVTGAFSRAFNEESTAAKRRRIHEQALDIVNRPAGDDGVVTISHGEFDLVVGDEMLNVMDASEKFGYGTYSIYDDFVINGDSNFYGPNNYAGHGGTFYRITDFPYAGNNPIYAGGVINYFKEGLMFAAAGYSVDQMNTAVVGWNFYKGRYSGISDRIGFANYGYFYWLTHK